MADNNWDDVELHAAVVAYVEMLCKQRSGEEYSKKSYYRALAEKYGRTEKSYEYRMENISYVRAVQGREWLTGLKPARNVGANVFERIEKQLSVVEGTEYEPSNYEFEVEKDIARLATTQEPPAGLPNPGKFSSSVTQFERDPFVKAWVLVNAKGVCECCQKTAPFQRFDGTPYLEGHHVRHLQDGGPDTIANMVALCPNCHREVHYGKQSVQLVERLYATIPRLTKG